MHLSVVSQHYDQPVPCPMSENYKKNHVPKHVFAKIKTQNYHKAQTQISLGSTQT